MKDGISRLFCWELFRGNRITANFRHSHSHSHNCLLCLYTVVLLYYYTVRCGYPAYPCCKSANTRGLLEFLGCLLGSIN